MKDILLKLLLIFLTLTCVGLATYTAVTNARDYSRTYDEPFHIDWNQRLLYEGESERESVYNYISTTPILLLNVLLADTIESYYPETKGSSRLFHLRLFTVFWLWAVCLFTFLLARYLAGFSAGCVATVLVSFEPNLVAHSSLATVDVAFAAITLVALYCTIKYSEKLSPYWALTIGLSFGLAFCIKYTSFLLVILPAIIPLGRQWFSLLRPKNLFALLCGVVVANYTVNCFYLYKHVGLVLSQYHFFNEKFLWLQSNFPSLPIPFPRDFITGFDHLAEAAKRSEWNVVFLGQWTPQGSGWYFFVSWLFKTPIAFIALVLSSVVLFVWHGAKHARYHFLSVLLFTLFLFFYFSFFVKVQVGLRYVLMCLPLFAVVVSAILFRSLSSAKAFWISMVVVCLSLVEIYPYRQNLISFSNSFISEKKSAYKYLADSNIDWGQNRNAISGHLQELGVGYDRLDSPHILPGLNVYSINQIIGVFWNFEKYAWVRKNLEPVRHIDHTLLVYDVSEEDFSRFLREKRAAEPLRGISPLSKLPLRGEVDSPVAIKSAEYKQHLVIESKNDTQIRIQDVRGIVKIGQGDNKGRCKLTEFGHPHEIWFQLEAKKRYLFCIPESEKEFEIAVHLKKDDIERQELFADRKQVLRKEESPSS